MAWIEVMTDMNKPVSIAPEHISAVTRADGDGCYVICDGRQYHVFNYSCESMKKLVTQAKARVL